MADPASPSHRRKGVALCAALVVAVWAGACTEVINHGVTPCTPETCDGCCSPLGTCLPGDNIYACGVNAVTCYACGAAERCSGGACVSNDATQNPEGGDGGACGPQSCTGCCAGGACIGIEEQSAAKCGSGGQVCGACNNTSTCVQGRCEHVARCKLKAGVVSGGDYGILDFGETPVGATNRQDIALKNVGDARCEVSAPHWIAGSDLGAFSFNGAPAYAINIEPGQLATFPVTFTPYAARAWVGFENGFTFFVNDDMPSECADPSPGCRRIILSGVGIAAQLTPTAPLLPPELDFGEVAVGCESGWKPVLLVNESAQPLAVEGVWTTGAGFEAEAMPLPFTVAPWATATLNVRFQPTAVGPATGKLWVNDNLGGVRSVPLTASGTSTRARTVSFTQELPGSADVLLVVRAGPNMGPLQMELGVAARTLFQRAAMSGGDLRVGVLSADVSLANAGLLQGSPKYVSSSTPNAADLVASNVRVGTASAIDQAFEAVRLALSPPNSTDPLRNGGFLRDGARLGVVFVSDAAENSGGALDGYARALRAVVRTPLWDRVRFYPIVTGTGCQSGGRYPEATSIVGGVCQSLTSTSLSAALENATTDLFRAREEYVLPQPIDPTAPWSVQVDHVTLPHGQVTLNVAHNSVRFSPIQIPEAGQQITVSYQAQCHP